MRALMRRSSRSRTFQYLPLAGATTLAFSSSGVLYTNNQYYVTQTGDLVDAATQTKHRCIPGVWSADRYYIWTTAANSV